MLPCFSREHKDCWWMTLLAALPMLKQALKRQALIPAVIEAPRHLLGLWRKWWVKGSPDWVDRNIQCCSLFLLIIFPGLDCTFHAQLVAWTVPIRLQQLKLPGNYLFMCKVKMCEVQQPFCLLHHQVCSAVASLGKAEECETLIGNTFQMPWSYNKNKIKPFKKSWMKWYGN